MAKTDVNCECKWTDGTVFFGFFGLLIRERISIGFLKKYRKSTCVFNSVNFLLLFIDLIHIMEMEDEDLFLRTTDIVDYWAYLKTVCGECTLLICRLLDWIIHLNVCEIRTHTTNQYLFYFFCSGSDWLVWSLANSFNNCSCGDNNGGGNDAKTFIIPNDSFFDHV